MPQDADLEAVFLALTGGGAGLDGDDDR